MATANEIISQATVLMDSGKKTEAGRLITNNVSAFAVHGHKLAAGKILFRAETDDAAAITLLEGAAKGFAGGSFPEKAKDANNHLIVLLDRTGKHKEAHDLATSKTMNTTVEAVKAIISRNGHAPAAAPTAPKPTAPATPAAKDPGDTTVNEIALEPETPISAPAATTAAPTKEKTSDPKDAVKEAAKHFKPHLTAEAAKQICDLLKSLDQKAMLGLGDDNKVKQNYLLMLGMALATIDPKDKSAIPLLDAFAKNTHPSKIYRALAVAKTADVFRLNGQLDLAKSRAKTAYNDLNKDATTRLAMAEVYAAEAAQNPAKGAFAASFAQAVLATKPNNAAAKAIVAQFGQTAAPTTTPSIEASAAGGAVQPGDFDFLAAGAPTTGDAAEIDIAADLEGLANKGNSDGTIELDEGPKPA